MPFLPVSLAPVILTFAPLFSQRVWPQAQALLLGAILAPGQRTVTSGLRILGLCQERHFVNYHRVLSRAHWRGREASRLLLGLLVKRFVPTGPIVLGIDDTIERRRGKRIQAKGIYRDPVRSSHSHFVKASGLRWMSLMLLAPIPWAARTWALPFLTCLAPSERYAQKHRKQHSHALATPHCAGLVRGRRSRRRDLHPHGGLVSLRVAARADSLGADPGPTKAFRSPSAAVYGFDPEFAQQRELVCAALAGRGDVSGGAKTSRDGNATAMGRAGHCPDNARLASFVFFGDVAGRPARLQEQAAPAERSLVHQTASDV
ncbi:MAG: transposase [Acidobacteriaceae bacterium]|nr:transposase [Acidobacteriaceae bacterium]